LRSCTDSASPCYLPAWVSSCLLSWFTYSRCFNKKRCSIQCCCCSYLWKRRLCYFEVSWKGCRSRLSFATMRRYEAFCCLWFWKGAFRIDVYQGKCIQYPSLRIWKRWQTFWTICLRNSQNFTWGFR